MGGRERRLDAADTGAEISGQVEIAGTEHEKYDNASDEYILRGAVKTGKDGKDIVSMLIRNYALFLKENPDFYKLDLKLRTKLLTEYFKDGLVSNLII